MLEFVHHPYWRRCGVWPLGSLPSAGAWCTAAGVRSSGTGAWCTGCATVVGVASAVRCRGIGEMAGIGLALVGPCNFQYVEMLSFPVLGPVDQGESWGGSVSPGAGCIPVKGQFLCCYVNRYELDVQGNWLLGDFADVVFFCSLALPCSCYDFELLEGVCMP